MKIKLIQAWVSSCLLFVCAVNNLAAQEQNPVEEQLTPIEQMRIEEQRLAEMPEELMQTIQLGQLMKAQFNDEEYLYRIHNDAYYYPTAVSATGDIVQLNDGSRWSVHPYQRKAVLYWVQSDLIFIKPKSSCFSMYSYVLQNRTTQEAIEVNLIGSPVPTGAYTRWIINIDPYKKLIQLNDDTIWQIDPNDYAFNKWQIGHRLLIGVNNYWRIAKYPHVLINTSLYNAPYSEAEFIGYPAGY